MSELHLREATPADIPALSRLGIDSFVAKFGHLYEDRDLLPFLDAVHSEAALGSELIHPERVYRLAERDGALVGYCKLGLACSFPEHARGSRCMEIRQLYTAPDATGGGIGSALMDWAMAECAAHGADEIQLSVWNENLDAQRFYARYGFERVADVHFRVGNHLDDEFLFAKML